jgi:hypothetical protein
MGETLMASRLLCIDPSLTHTGMAMMHSGGSLLESRTIVTKPDVPLTVRLRQIFDGVTEFCHLWRADELERCFRIEMPPAALSRPGRFARVANAASIQGLTLATGMAIAAIYSCGVRTEQVELVPPAGNYRLNGRKLDSKWKKQIAREVAWMRWQVRLNEHEAEAALLSLPATTTEIAQAWAKLRSETTDALIQERTVILKYGDEEYALTTARKERKL